MAATTRLPFGLTNVTCDPGVFGIDFDPTCPGRCSQHPRRAPLRPSGRLHDDGASCPGGPNSLRRGLWGRARRIGARMFAHASRHTCRGGRVGRSNRNVEESEAEGNAPQILAGKWEEQYKPATGSHAKRLWQPCQPDPRWPPVDSLRSLCPHTYGTGGPSMTVIRIAACQGVGDLSTRRAALCHSRVHVEVRKLDFVEVTTTQGRDVNGTEKVSGRAGRALQWDGGRVGDCDTE
jgi:hypothetical protein